MGVSFKILNTPGPSCSKPDKYTTNPGLTLNKTCREH